MLVLHDEVADDGRGDKPRKGEGVGYVVDIFAEGGGQRGPNSTGESSATMTGLVSC